MYSSAVHFGNFSSPPLLLALREGHCTLVHTPPAHVTGRGGGYVYVKRRAGSCRMGITPAT
jgi:hypothetical protein